MQFFYKIYFLYRSKFIRWKIFSEFTFLCLFFLIIPFVYTIQVFAKTPEAGLLGYFPLIAALIIALINGGFNRQLFSCEFLPGLLGVLVSFIIIHNAISGFDLILQGNIGIGGRVLCLFVLPWAIFLLTIRYSLRLQWKLVGIIGITASVVALEMLLENIYIWRLHESSPFQLLNSEYVLAQTGKNLTQLYLPFYRGTGLLEHVHASTFFVGIGLVAWISMFLRSGNKFHLMGIIICESVLIVHGVRIALLASCVAVLGLLFLVRESQLPFVRARLQPIAWTLCLVALFVILLDPFGTVQKFYLPAFLYGNWTPDSAIAQSPSSVMDHGLKAVVLLLASRLEGGWSSPEFFAGLFGHGIGASLVGHVVGLDDDFFVLQIFAQYGLIGGAAFFLLFVLAAVIFWTTFKKIDRGDGILLMFAVTLLVLLLLSTLHSGVIQRKTIFPIFLWAFAIVYSSSLKGGK